ncbi:group II intron reverse transcriptase/maturase [Paenibacillus sophorae]|uniref:Group II intron reverse transcriptase/maturase n=1 Tax=Paenibacillus sophorae TaxID=1333845 RepID=A0A1H8UEI9_9BACL|nr:group II intron reverse transcriptase/maturase [Paenibacillus sophorae]QWU13163.1 group II intron reverse transcriptase/maturase [Paenibacillus sophorae]SEP01447.1 group II intron reverse transcriptase/maturase [Paenibacillus sophorae]
MAQQFDYPKSETDLRNTLDALYQIAKTAFENGNRPSLTGLIELMSAEATIITAIHNIKSNKGSHTPGVDSKVMGKDYLQKPYKWVIQDIQRAFMNYKPQKIRRVHIDKPGKTEKRPLGIPTIRDRIVQECVRIVLEPILEAQFYKHSYGFRPMRDAQMALDRVVSLVHLTGYYWIVEGDISKCFDRINHTILLKRLYHLGIKDRRVIQMVKAMLKAGVLDECEVNEDGTPQGGLCSPLLANVYLDILDEWVTKQWENKRTAYNYKRHDMKLEALRKRSALTPGYLVRYADDFVIITDSRQHAEDWKARIQQFLNKDMKLNLSSEKTLITDVRKKHIHFLGYEYKVVRGKARNGHIPRTLPDRKRLKQKVNTIAQSIKGIPRCTSREQVVREINRVNSQIRGIVNYYQCCTWVNIAVQKYAHRLRLTAKQRLKQYNGIWIPAKDTQNLPRVHEKYTRGIPAINYLDSYIGITDLSFCKWERTYAKNPEETPFTAEGRQLYFERTKRTRINNRLDEIYNERTSEVILYSPWGRHYNFEFYMNRAYALNRDRLKCRVCGGWLISHTPYTHRINPGLPEDKVNKVSNLVSMHKQCFEAVNDPNTDISEFEPKARRKIMTYREKLDNSHVKRLH